MRFAAFALALLIPGTALAAPSWDFGCDSDPSNDGNRTINAPTSTTSPLAARVACFSFVDADSTATSGVFNVAAAEAMVCFDADTASASAGAGRVKVFRSPNYSTTFSVNTWMDMGGMNGEVALDGTQGPASTQNACKVIQRGQYVISISTACDSDACRVTIEGL